MFFKGSPETLSKEEAFTATPQKKKKKKKKTDTFHKWTNILMCCT